MYIILQKGEKALQSRTKLRDRILPAYTKGEEIMNMVTHIAGGAIGIAVLVLCVVFAALRSDAWAVVSTAIYGTTLIILYTVSSTYHGLRIGTAKKVMQIIDHCAIFFLIAGTYTPILLAGIRPFAPGMAWTIFGIEWAVTFAAATFNAIDLKKFSKISMVCYVAMGWCVVLVLKLTIRAMTVPGFLWLLGGGIMYTIGAVLYAVGKKKKYVHSVFHIFVVLASVMHFFAIFFYIVL